LARLKWSMSTKFPVLQVALDMANLHRAIQISKEAVEGGVDWIEVGTPLIKSEGMEAIRSLRRTFPKHTIVADMKTADVGGYETEMAAKSGADVMVILGVSNDGTILEAIRAGKQYNCKIMCDLISVIDKVGRAREIEALGADYLALHIGIDQQMEGDSPVTELRDIVEAVDIPVAVAGGLNSETVAEVVEAGASIVVVGGAIIKARDVTGATAVLLEAIESRKKIETKLFKKYTFDQLREVLSQVSSCNVSDAMHRKGALRDLQILLPPGAKMVGPVLTVKTMDGDWAKPVEAIERANKGDVIVIDAGGGFQAIWGELASWSSKVKGIAGVVIDGAARDVTDIVEMGFPVFARHLVPNAGEPKGLGEIGVDVIVSGQKASTGDWIIGDQSGVVVIPRRRAVEVANRALDVHEKENRLREEIQRGSTLSEVLYLEKWETMKE